MSAPKEEEKKNYSQVCFSHRMAISEAIFDFFLLLKVPRRRRAGRKAAYGTAARRICLSIFTVLSISLLVLISVRHPREEGNDDQITLVAVTTDDKTAVNSSQCNSMLDRELIPVSISEFRIQLITAMPGSGSDWARESIKLLTGHIVRSVYDYRNSSVTNTSVATKDRPIYYKTHYPFFPNAGVVDTYLYQNAQRVSVIIRDPFDAGFAEYVRECIYRRRGPSTTKNVDRKYVGISEYIKSADFFTENKSDKSMKPSVAFQSYYQYYLKQYETFHKYWLSRYSGKLKVILYNDLMRNASLFIDLAEYLGYDYRSRLQREKRVTCFLQSTEKTENRKRPSLSLIEDSKSVLRLMFKSNTQEQINLVQKLLLKKLPDEENKIDSGH